MSKNDHQHIEDTGAGPALNLFRLPTSESEWQELRRRWSANTAFLLPIFVIVALIVLIHESGQLSALARSLSAAMQSRTDYYSGGYAAGTIDVLVWWFSCGIVLWVSTSYLDTKVAKSGAAIATGWRPGELLLHWLAAYLILSPLIAAGLDGWQREVVLSLLLTGPMLRTFFSMGRWCGVAGTVSTVLSIYANAYELTLLAVIPISVFSMGLYFHPSVRHKPVLRWIALIGAPLIMMLVTVGPIFARSLLTMPPNSHPEWNSKVWLLAVWWVVPSLSVLALRTLPEATRGRVGNAAALGVVAFLCIAICNRPASILALSTLCLLVSALLALSNILRISRIGVIRRVLAYFFLIGAVLSFRGMAPVLDSGAAGDRHASPNESHGSSSFPAFYEQWLNARGETASNPGPLVLVAIAGGGIRAAAHASLTLALADDLTQRKFGDRTLLLSSVSGGALGAATWLGQRTDGLKPAESSRILSGGISPGALQLARFYRNDFVSPTVNRMLLHDFPLGVMWHGLSDRDQILAASWADAWDELMMSSNSDSPAVSIFRRSVSSLATDRRLPLTVFNATSATDGRGAIYSSAAGVFPSTWMLDGDESVKRAVLDSARFAVVSPIGSACAMVSSSSTPVPSLPNAGCRPGFAPIAVADGGYHDNSGLAAVADVLDQLAKLNTRMDNVFVVVVESNPEDGLAVKEGTRFDNGRLLPELLAPAWVQEAARSAHSEAYVKRILNRPSPPHLLTWRVSREALARILRDRTEESAWGIPILDQRARQANFEQQLRIAPLGWTMDPSAFHGLHADSLIARDLPIIGPCESALCRALAGANSPETKLIRSKQAGR